MRIFRIQRDDAAHYARAVENDSLELLDAAPWAGGRPTGTRVERSAARLLAPVTPTKIVCVGRNYAAHAKELGNEVPSTPLLFLKPPSSLLAPGATIELPPSSERVEHEAEIGVVIGRQLKNASPEQARTGVYGVTCVNDVTARDLQRKDVQFTRAKSFDTFCPVGPWIETQFDLLDMRVTGRVDGVVRQTAPVTDMVFPILDLVVFISQIMTLEPGDLIATGTPEGVGPLLAGNEVEVEISGVGVLKNLVGRARDRETRRVPA
jgi:2-keto-4-pentenoate hydratase/2-oxohepta-3-ene-1,7-dioic acid hydratase in catechol pathway